MAAGAGGLPMVGEPPAGQPAAGEEVRRLLDAGRFGAAFAATDRALSRGEAAPELHRLRAEALTGLLDYAGAVEALALAPADARNLALRTRLLALLGRDEEAAAAAEALTAGGYPLPPAERIELARTLRGAGLVESAGRVLGPPRTGESGDVALERARLRIAADDCPGALGPLETAASASPAVPGAAYELGRCLALLGRREEAGARLRVALALFPEDRAARFRLGQFLLREEDPRRQAEGRRLLAGYEEARLRERRRRLLLSQITAGEHEGAALRDTLAQLLGLLLDAAESEGGPTTAAAAETERVLAAATERFPDDPAFRIARARQRLLSGPDGPRRAAAHLEPLVPPAPAELTGPERSAARWLAEARLREGDPAAAAALFDRVLTGSGGSGFSPRVLRAAATAFALAGDPARGLALFDRALAATAPSPARAALLADSALALSLLGREPEAESRYREALSVEPRQVSASLGLAERLLASDRAAEAATVLRRALAHAPENEALRALLSRAEPPPR